MGDIYQGAYMPTRAPGERRAQIAQQIAAQLSGITSPASASLGQMGQVNDLWRAYQHYSQHGQDGQMAQPVTPQQPALPPQQPSLPPQQVALPPQMTGQTAPLPPNTMMPIGSGGASGPGGPMQMPMGLAQWRPRQMPFDPYAQSPSMASIASILANNTNGY